MFVFIIIGNNNNNHHHHHHHYPGHVSDVPDSPLQFETSDFSTLIMIAMIGNIHNTIETKLFFLLRVRNERLHNDTRHTCLYSAHFTDLVDRPLIQANRINQTLFLVF